MLDKMNFIQLLNIFQTSVTERMNHAKDYCTTEDISDYDGYAFHIK